MFFGHFNSADESWCELWLTDPYASVCSASSSSCSLPLIPLRTHINPRKSSHFHQTVIEKHCSLNISELAFTPDSRTRGIWEKTQISTRTRRSQRNVIVSAKNWLKKFTTLSFRFIRNNFFTPWRYSIPRIAIVTINYFIGYKEEAA